MITASRASERAREDAEGGIFTKAVLQELSQDRADEVTGEVSISRLFDGVSRELKGSGQEPIYIGGGSAITLVWYPPKNPVITAIISEECPYQGLKPFEKEQARFFFGREKVIQLLLEKLGQANFVPIIGASGSGKSSVVRAGLIPQLEKNGWQVLEPMQPGYKPLAKLERVFEKFFQGENEEQLDNFIHNHPDGLCPLIKCLPGSERFLLVVDQFEEVFTLCPKEKEEERRRFIKLLTSCPPEGRLEVILTIRADFLEPCLSYESLNRLIQEQVVLMPSLVRADLEEAITTPAKLQGYSFGDGLLGAILHDVGQEKGCLPLLQFALTELWEERDRQTHQLTLAKYNELGGVIGALNRHAEQIYQSFREQQQGWVKRIFLKLVRTGAEQKDTRQRQPKSKLLAIAGENLADCQVLSKVLEQLIAGRLLVTDPEGEDLVDLTHEALMEGWKQFAAWRQEDRELRRLIDRVEDALREWQKKPQDENLLPRGLLDQVRQKWLELESDLDTPAKEFYQRSDAHEQEQTNYELLLKHLNLPREKQKHFGQIIRVRKVAAQWLDANQETLIEATAQYVFNRGDKLGNFSSSADLQEKVEKFEWDIYYYLLWIYRSLEHGKPIPLDRVEDAIKPSLPSSAYVEAFNFIKRERVSDKLRDQVAEELEFYLNYLIDHFSYSMN